MGVFGLGLATKIYVAIEAVDMRKGFEGLYGLVRDQLGADPLSGHLFLFSNRTRTRLKALVWDESDCWHSTPICDQQSSTESESFENLRTIPKVIGNAPMLSRVNSRLSAALPSFAVWRGY